jgi:hypothetical protein
MQLVFDDLGKPLRYFLVDLAGRPALEGERIFRGDDEEIEIVRMDKGVPKGDRGPRLNFPYLYRRFFHSLPRHVDRYT